MSHFVRQGCVRLIPREGPPPSCGLGVEADVGPSDMTWGGGGAATKERPLGWSPVADPSVEGPHRVAEGEGGGTALRWCGGKVLTINFRSAWHFAERSQERHDVTAAASGLPRPRASAPRPAAPGPPPPGAGSPVHCLRRENITEYTPMTDSK